MISVAGAGWVNHDDPKNAGKQDAKLARNLYRGFCHMIKRSVLPVVPDIHAPSEDPATQNVVRKVMDELLEHSHAIGRISHRDANIQELPKYGGDSWQVRRFSTIQEDLGDSISPKKKCSCTMFTLMSRGCQCGGI